MIIWNKYDSQSGENIEFCCDTLKEIYGNLLTWEPGDKKWVIKVDRFTTFMYPYTSKMVTKKVEGVQDLKPIEYCPFCGKNLYKKDLRYDSWVRGVCGERPYFHMYVCGAGPNPSGTVPDSGFQGAWSPASVRKVL